jgi:hypothetical protein
VGGRSYHHAPHHQGTPSAPVTRTPTRKSQDLMDLDSPLKTLSVASLTGPWQHYYSSKQAQEVNYFILEN